jgi:hypothetical protein
MKPVKSLKTHAIISLCLIFMANSVYGQQPRDYIVQLTTSTTENPATISFNWNPIPGESIISIYRKNKDISDWGAAIASLPANANEYTDNTVETGVEYEYKITKTSELRPVITYVSAGIKCREVEYRGKVILLVDSSFVDSLQYELIRFETDLLGDGWEVLRKDISRNASVKYVKSVIRNFYDSDTVNVKAVFLFGHIPVPYSGCEAYDYHDEEIGAWQADMYYGSMNEKNWTDETTYCTGAIRSENRNIPGDGKFDMTELPLDEIISLQVGRVDLYNLPAFPQSESELLKSYLNKNHDFRHKKNEPKLQALVDDNFGWFGGGAPAISGWRNFTALLNSPSVNAGDYFSDMKNDSYIWSYGCGGGDAAFTGTYCGGVGTTTDFVNKSPRTVFTSLFGSVIGNWDYQDNLMRSALASKGWILTCMWSGRPYYIFHQMGMGETIGYGIRATQNNINTYDYQEFNRCIHIGLLGDPALRMHIVCPVNSLQSAITSNNAVMLAWKPADDSIIGYNVYKRDTVTNKYHKMTPSPVTDTYFEDTVPVAGNNYYMVKTFKLSQVASGSYFNLSQGIFDTVSYMQQTPVAITDIDLSLNPGNIQPLKIYDAFTVDVTVSPENATNKLLKFSVENITGNGKLDKNGEVFPEKGGVFAVIAEALDGSGIKGRLEVTVDSVPDAAGTITGEESVCRDNKSELYTIPEIRGASSYIWILPNGVSDTGTINEIAYSLNSSAASGDIKVKGHNPYADGAESKLYVTVNEIPPKPVIKLEGNVLHSNASLGNQWYVDGTMIEGATDSVYTPVQEGSYQVKVTLNNCTSLSSKIIIFPPTIIDVTDLKNEIIIFPNPSAGQFNVSFGTTPVRQATIIVFNLQGNLVYSEIFQNATRASIDLIVFPKGMYIVKVITDENNYYGKVCLE